MKLVAVWLGLLSGVAHADAKTEVTAMVVKNAKALADNDAEAYNETIGENGLSREITMGSPLARIWGGMVTGEHPKMSGVAHDLKELTVVENAKDKTAYFIGIVDASYDAAGGPRKHIPVRVNGIAKHVDAGWKVYVISYARTIADAELFTQLDTTVAPHEPRRTNFPIEDQVTLWFEGKPPVAIEHDRSQGPVVIARGTAPSEIASGGAAVDKLVKQWDTLHLFDTVILGGELGDTAYVGGGVAFPMKGGAVRMTFSAIFVREAKAWRWVSLDFAPQPPK